MQAVHSINRLRSFAKCPVAEKCRANCYGQMGDFRPMWKTQFATPHSLSPYSSFLLFPSKDSHLNLELALVPHARWLCSDTADVIVTCSFVMLEIKVHRLDSNSISIEQKDDYCCWLLYSVSVCVQCGDVAALAPQDTKQRGCFGDAKYGRIQLAVSRDSILPPSPNSFGASSIPYNSISTVFVRFLAADSHLGWDVLEFPLNLIRTLRTLMCTV